MPEKKIPDGLVRTGTPTVAREPFVDTVTWQISSFASDATRTRHETWASSVLPRRTPWLGVGGSISVMPGGRLTVTSCPSRGFLIHAVTVNSLPGVGFGL